MQSIAEGEKKCYTIDRDHLGCVKVMMEAKADVNTRGWKDETTLAAVLNANHFNCLMLLPKALALGAVLNNQEELTASVTSMLLAHGVGIDAAEECTLRLFIYIEEKRRKN